MPLPSQKRSDDSAPRGGRFGSSDSYWMVEGQTFDLTRGMPDLAISLNCASRGKEQIVKLDPNRTALVIIDMQNYFLHPELANGKAGQALVPALTEVVKSCRQRGIKVHWLNWGLTEEDLTAMPPTLLYVASDGDPDHTFGSELGKHYGRKFMLDSWNARTFDELYDLQEAGRASGTDFLCHKNRQSGLWDQESSYAHHLKSQNITTLLFAGVNTVQCVFGTILDAFCQGYDTCLVTDLCGTTSPDFATQMVIYNMANRGWTTTSQQILQAIGSPCPVKLPEQEEAC